MTDQSIWVIPDAKNKVFWLKFVVERPEQGEVDTHMFQMSVKTAEKMATDTLDAILTMREGEKAMSDSQIGTEYWREQCAQKENQIAKLKADVQRLRDEIASLQKEVKKWKEWYQICVDDG